MRSQFPRHLHGRIVSRPEDEVSISDEKPVPSPPQVSPAFSSPLAQFQSQMRSQFPRHLDIKALQELVGRVSISDEKPVPSPHLIVSVKLFCLTTVALRKGGIVPGIFLGKFPGTTSTSCVSRFDVPC